MSVENKIQTKLIELLKSVDASIPVSWSDVHIYIEMSEDGGTVYFDFKPENESKYHYNLSISDEFDVSDSKAKEFRHTQRHISYELWKLFVDNNLPIWSSAVISYKNKKLSTKFDYTPWIESEFGPTDRRNFYKYENLNYQPRDNKEEELFKQMTIFRDKYNKEQLD